MRINFINKKPINHDRVKQLLSISEANNHFSNDGPVKAMLEKKLESMLYLSDSKVICVSSGTAALHLIMMYKTDIKSWATTSFNFPSAIVNNMHVNVYDEDQIDNATEQGIIIPNLFGTNCTKNYSGKFVIYDNASSPINTNSKVDFAQDYSFGSLHHTKYLGFGEGGFLIVPKDEYLKINSHANFGYFFNKKSKANSSNFKMSDVSAAYILQHIEQYEINNHQRVQSYLIDKIESIDGVEMFNYDYGTIYGNLPIVFDKPIDRDIFLKLGIEVNKYYTPLKNKPKALELYKRILNFPLFETMAYSQMDYMIECIKNVAENQ